MITRELRSISRRFLAARRIAISMARDLKLRVIAEGAETQAEPELLQAHLSDEAHGYYFSHPVPSEHFAKLLEDPVLGHYRRPSVIRNRLKCSSLGTITEAKLLHWPHLQAVFLYQLAWKRPLEISS